MPMQQLKSGWSITITLNERLLLFVFKDNEKWTVEINFGTVVDIQWALLQTTASTIAQP